MPDTHTHIQTNTHASTHARTHARTHTCTHTHTNINTHTVCVPHSQLHHTQTETYTMKNANKCTVMQLFHQSCITIYFFISACINKSIILQSPAILHSAPSSQTAIVLMLHAEPNCISLSSLWWRGGGNQCLHVTQPAAGSLPSQIPALSIKINAIICSCKIFSSD